MILSPSYAQVWPGHEDGKPISAQIDLVITFVEFETNFLKQNEKSLNTLRFGVKNIGETPVKSFDIACFISPTNQTPSSNLTCSKDALLLHKKIVPPIVIQSGEEILLEEKNVSISKASDYKLKLSKGYLVLCLNGKDI